MSRRRSAGLLAFVVLFGFMARAATYKSPLLDHHAWRQADTASIARNFLRERFNLFYPQIDQRGSRAEGYVETGLELFAYSVALVSLLVGFHPETGRILSALCFVGSCLFAWTFVRRRYGDRAGHVAAFVYAFGFPLALYIERAFMNEALLIFLSLGSLVAAQRCVGGTWDPPSGGLTRAAAVFALLLCTSLIAAIKLPYLVIWAPIAGLLFERDGWRAARRWEPWLMAGVNLAVAFAWYRHAHALGEMTGQSFGLGDKLFDSSTVFTLTYPSMIIGRLFKDVLGPIAFTFGAIGVGVAWSRRRWCELLGVLGFVSYVVIVSEGNVPHDYYQLVIIPVAPMLATLGVLTASEWLGRGSRVRTEKALRVMLALVAVSTFVRSVSAHGWYEYEAADAELCRSLAMTTQPGERVAIVGDQNPWLMFCLDRKGWLMLPAEATESRLRQVWQEGARLVVIPRPPNVESGPLILSQAGRRVLATDKVFAFRLD